MIVVLSDPETATTLPPGAIAPIDERAYRLTNPMCHLAELDANGRLNARCSLWRAKDPRGADTTTGFIGHFAAAESGRQEEDAGQVLLAHACERLAREGCLRAVGPIDGSTWHRYRFVTERSEEPMFFLEPDNPDAWPAMFEAGGFEPLATYTSALAADLSETDVRTPTRIQSLEDAGIRFRTLVPAELTAELTRLYDLSTLAFADNFLYSPIDSRTFTEMYLALGPYLVPELVQLAEQDGVLVGYVFGLPDMLSVQRGETRKTMIVKTAAIHPAHAGLGLGSVLVDLCQRAGHALGYERAIHALMHETNRSRAISGKYGKTIRRYTLYAKDLRA